MNQQIQAAVEAASAASVPMSTKISLGVAGSGAATAVLGNATGNEIAAYLGVFVAALGAIASVSITWYFKSREDKRAAYLYLIELELKKRKLADCIEDGDCG